MPKRILQNLAKILRLRQAIERFGLFRGAERENLAQILSKNTDGFAKPELKLKIYEVILELRRRLRKKFGLLIVLGWRREWNEKHASIPDVTQDIFSLRQIEISKCSFGRAVAVIQKTVDFDGAILISRDGFIRHSGVFLENMQPKQVASVLNPGKAEDLSSAFGFAQKVHTRHLAAIAASYTLNGTTAFVLSEEDSTIRIMEKGKIIWSTVREEISRIVEMKK